MSLLLLLVALAVVGVLAAVVTGRLDASLPEPVGSSPHRTLPPRRLAPADVDGLRFSLAVRGYRMDEVDAVLDRLGAELADRDAQLAELRAPGALGAGSVEPRPEDLRPQEPWRDRSWAVEPGPSAPPPAEPLPVARPVIDPLTDPRMRFTTSQLGGRAWSGDDGWTDGRDGRDDHHERPRTGSHARADAWGLGATTAGPTGPADATDASGADDDTNTGRRSARGSRHGRRAQRAPGEG